MRIHKQEVTYMQQNQNSNRSTPEKLLPLDEVERRTGFKSSFIYKQIRNKAFPPPVKIGNASRWPESQVDAWVLAQIEKKHS